MRPAFNVAEEPDDGASDPGAFVERRMEPPHWLTQITLGNILSVCTVVVLVSGFAYTMKGDVAKVDEAGKTREARIERLEVDTNRRFGEVSQQVRDARTEAREDSTEVKALIRDLGQKIDQKADKPR